MSALSIYRTPVDRLPSPPVLPDPSVVQPHYDPPRKYSPQLSGWRFALAYARACVSSLLYALRARDGE